MCRDLNDEIAKLAKSEVGPATYTLKPSDGSSAVDLSIREERFMAPECYFQPKLAGMDVAPLQNLVDEAVFQCPIDSRRKLYSSIWLSVCTAHSSLYFSSC